MYITIKTVKGRRYRYLQRTWREGKRVRSQSVYLGPADGHGRPKAKAANRGPLRRLAGLIKANLATPEERLLARLAAEVGSTEAGKPRGRPRTTGVAGSAEVLSQRAPASTDVGRSAEPAAEGEDPGGSG